MQMCSVFLVPMHASHQRVTRVAAWSIGITRTPFEYCPPFLLHPREARLPIASPFAPLTRSYSHLQYEQQMFWFNTVYRVSRWPLEAPLDNNGDTRYDACAEAHILREYLRRFHAPESPGDLNARVAKLSADLSRHLPGGHTLATRPLNKWLEERSAEAPFNQRARGTDSSVKRRRIIEHLPSGCRTGEQPVTSASADAGGAGPSACARRHADACDGGSAAGAGGGGGGGADGNGRVVGEVVYGTNGAGGGGAGAAQDGSTL